MADQSTNRFDYRGTAQGILATANGQATNRFDFRGMAEGALEVSSTTTTATPLRCLMGCGI